MFVVYCSKFDEFRGGQVVVVHSVEELCRLLVVRVRSSGLWIEWWRARVICVGRFEKWRVFGEVREGLMVKLENDVRVVCRLRIILERHVPAAGIPFPADPGVIEPVADGLDVTWLRRITVINQQSPRWISRARRERRLCGLDSIHSKLAVERELVIMQRFSRWIVTGLPAGRDRRCPRRTLRCYQPLMVEK